MEYYHMRDRTEVVYCKDMESQKYEIIFTFTNFEGHNLPYLCSTSMSYMFYRLETRTMSESSFI